VTGLKLEVPDRHSEKAKRTKNHIKEERTGLTVKSLEVLLPNTEQEDHDAAALLLARASSGGGE
jgi:hypothetical protein